jgi:hypothetical protein
MLDPYSDEEKDFIDKLLKKYFFRLGTKKDNYRIYRN